MASRVLQRLTLAAVLVGLVSLTAATSSEAKPRPGARRANRPTAARGFNLFAGSVNVLMNVNRVQCNVNNIGESCVDPTNSPVLGGGFWPKGSPNQYIFNSGLQLAAIIPGADQPNFDWPGDTTGAFFFDATGLLGPHGEGRTNVFNALNADDLLNWPTAANVNDPTMFHPSLLGRQTVSQQDTWVRMWDGNATLVAGRQHPMGVLVEQRGLAWNFPSGNQDIVYFLYRFINITATDPARYAGLSAVGYSPADITEIVAIAQEFQDRSEAAFNVQIPDTGYAFTQMYAAFGQDPDVGQAGANYSNANLIFSLAMAYKSDFRETTWQFPADINGAPFAAAPGFEAVKYLQSPNNIGIAMAGNTTNGGAFPDANGVQKLWRYLSGNLIASDGVTCTVGAQAQARHFCYWASAIADTRFFESSGPLTMGPGESRTIVVAYIHAAPLGNAPAATPPFGPALPAFNLSAFVGGNMVPGLAIDGARLRSGADTIRNVDRAMGWLNHGDPDGDNIVEQCSSPPPAPCVTEVSVAPRSALGKSLVAQAVFDNQFLLPFAPEVPVFFLVPGDNQVTIAWQQSSTEQIGDPFFTIASNIASPLYDPNFRQFDVEGYRIWRGRTQSSMEVIASFDYQGTSITDFNGQFTEVAYGSQCAPELGLTQAPAGSCPTFPRAIPLAGNVVQVPPGGRVEMAGAGTPNAARGNVLITVADTAVVGGGSGLPELQDNSVPFAFVDNEVRNGFRYFYSVTAFDVNSVKSGPSSLESPLVTKTVTPRVPSTNNLPAIVVTGMLGGDGTTQLDPNAGYPSIDPADGTFNGPVPPSNGGTISFLASVSEALGQGNYVIRVDSISAGSLGGLGTPGNTMYVTAIAGTVLTPLTLPLSQVNFAVEPGVTAEASLTYSLVPYDSAQAQRLGIAFTQDVRMPVQLTAHSMNPTNTSAGIGLQAGRFGEAGNESRYFSHSRWFDASGQEPADPTISPFAHASQNSGALTGVTLIYKPVSYRLPIQGEAAPANTAIRDRARSIDYTRTAWYPADFVVTWGAGGAVTVRDSTHRTDLPFNSTYGTGYGFTNASVFTAAGVTATNLCGADAIGTFTAGTCTGQAATAPDPAVVGYRHLYFHFPANVQRGITRLDMQATATLQPLDMNNDGAQDNTGIALTINSETFFMAMAALPAAGTQWHLRAIGGEGMTANCTPAVAAPMLAAPTDCSGYSFAPSNTIRPPYAPGLQFAIQVTQSFALDSAAGDISNVHTVPDPYYVTNSLEATANSKILRFVNIPNQAIVRIYSTSGILVNVLTHNDAVGGGELVWNLRNRNNQFVASGVYFFHVEASDGRTKVGRFTVVNFAQ